MRLAALALAVSLAPLPAHAQDGILFASPRDTLIGVKALRVVVEDLHKEMEGHITSQQLRTQLELKLRQNGITVLDPDTNLVPMLYIRVAGLITASEQIVYTISLEVLRYVEIEILDDKPAARQLSAAVWETGNFGLVPVRSAHKVTESVGLLMDQFLNDYLAANPKKLP